MKRFHLVIFLAVGTLSFTQGQKVTQENYKNAVSFLRVNYDNKTVFNLFTYASWFDDKSGIWFIDHSKEGRTYKTVSFKKKKVTELFDHKRLAASLSEVTNRETKALALSLSRIQRTKEGLTFRTNRKDYVVNLKTYEITENKPKKREVRNRFESKSPDGKWIAYAKDYNLFIKSTETNEEYQLSYKGEKEYQYASWYRKNDKMEGEKGERPQNFHASWSRDSKWISTTIIDTRNAGKMHLLDWSINSSYRPKLLSYYRGSPGDTTVVYVTPAFFNIQSKKEVKTKLPTNSHVNAVGVGWLEESGKLIANYSERGFLKQHVKLVDLNTNTEQTLITETSDISIDNFRLRILREKQKIVFLSERSGWSQLYMVDLKTNTTKPLTNGNYYVNAIRHIDQKQGIIYFLASGKETENNPYHQQVYKVDLKGEVTLLTPEKTHHVVNFSRDGKYFLDNHSTVQIPTKTVLRLAETGKIVTELTTADLSEVAAKGWQAPEVFSLTAKDGQTTIYGAMWKPINFDASKSYPIIDASYTWAATQVFPTSFNNAFIYQSEAELGFIVVRIDGLGTAGRSKEFRRHSYQNKENNLEDHVLAIKHLADKYSWIDGSRVGIFGHSAGGYDAGRALLGFPDFYKVGVASSGNHDFKIDKALFPEMHQEFPMDKKTSNVTNAKNLKGKLLLVHGGLDDNVNPSETFKLAEALVKADKDFDLLILPSQRHVYQGQHRRYFTKKRWNYFVEHLLNETPIWNFEWE